MKTCKSCNLDKEYNDFHLYKLSKDGYRYICKSCENSRKRVKNKEKKEDRQQWYKEYREKNRETILKRERAYYSKNAKKMREESKRYYESNKEAAQQRHREYAKQNPHIGKANHAKRRGSQKQAALSYDVYKSEIYKIYKECPKGYHVDHIIPLRGKEVCGLHVPWNLQYLTAEQNLKKSNRLLTTDNDNDSIPIVSSEIKK